MRRSNKLTWLVLGLLLLLLVTACEPEKAPVAAYLPQLDNSLPGGMLVRSYKLDNGRFEFTTAYSTSYDTTRWRVTDSKTLNLSASINPLGTSVEVLVEHVHADVSLKSTYASLDGWPQDSADFKLHTGSEAGVVVTNDYPYQNIFVIEGFSQSLINGWGYFTAGYGYTSLEQKRLTEENLVRLGRVYGNKVQIVWFLLVKYPGESRYHAVSVVDEFLIPVASAAKPR